MPTWGLGRAGGRFGWETRTGSTPSSEEWSKYNPPRVEDQPLFRLFFIPVMDLAQLPRNRRSAPLSRRPSDDVDDGCRYGEILGHHSHRHPTDPQIKTEDTLLLRPVGSAGGPTFDIGAGCHIHARAAGIGKLEHGIDLTRGTTSPGRNCRGTTTCSDSSSDLSPPRWRRAASATIARPVPDHPAG